MRKILGILIMVAALPAQAETAYVSERLPLALHAAVTEGSPVVKTLEGGAALEVLERADKFVHVRDKDGTEGWIEARFLSNAAPARPQLERAQAEFAKTQKELAEAQAKVKQLEAKLADESTRGNQLAQTAEQVKAQAASQVEAASKAAESAASDTDFSWGWLVLAFAMLWIGFGAGVVWLRERHRKRLGGMYLRI